LKWNRLIVIGSSLLLLVLLSIAYGVVQPRSAAGKMIFRVGYVLPTCRPSFLRVYQWSLHKFNSDYYPKEVDDKKSFRNWWSNGSDWPLNKDENPLAGTGTIIFNP
jgi:hypothetical protein